METRKKIMYHDYFSNFARRNCAFFSNAVPVHRVVRAVIELKMATGCKFRLYRYVTRTNVPFFDH